MRTTATGVRYNLSKGPGFAGKFKPKRQTRAGFRPCPGLDSPELPLGFRELRAKRCKSHQAGAEQTQGHPAVRNRCAFGIRREGEG